LKISVDLEVGNTDYLVMSNCGYIQLLMLRELMLRV